jgi:hypothetical protein
MLRLVPAVDGLNTSGTLLYTDAMGSDAWTAGNLLLKDMTSGKIDTLVRGKIYGGVFSPDGRKAAFANFYSKIDSVTTDSGRLQIIDLFTRKIDTLFTAAAHLDQLTWNSDNCIYLPLRKYLCRLDIATRKLDTLHTVLGDMYPNPDTTNFGVTEGNFSGDAKRAAFIEAKGTNHSTSILIGGSEVVVNGNQGTKASCQAGISLDGKWVSTVGVGHTVGYAHAFHRNDSVYAHVYSPPTAAGAGTVIWMFRFSRSANDRLLFHTPKDKIAHLWLLDINRFYPVLTGGCVWDLYTPGWVLDTVPAQPPINLQGVVVSDRRIALSWTAPASAASDGDHPSWYVIERNGARIAVIDSTNFVDEPFSGNTDYDYSVYSKDDGVRLSTALNGRFRTAVDAAPPIPVAVYSFSDSSLDVCFSEPVDSVSSISSGGYTVTPSVSVNRAVLTSESKVRLTTDSLPFTENCLLTVSSVKDRSQASNILVSASCPVTILRHQSGPWEWDFMLKDVQKVRFESAYVKFREYFRHVPEKFIGLPFLRPASGDLARYADTLLPYIAFNVNRPVRVFVTAHSGKESLNPSWLRSWKLTGDTIEQALVYSRDFEAGAVVLNGHNKAAYSPYCVIVAPLDSALLAEEAPCGPLIEGVFLRASPQPFTGAITLTCGAAKHSRLRLAVYGMDGRLVRNLMDADVSKGNHIVKWDGRDALGKRLSCGVYLCRLYLDKRIAQTRRIVAVR